MLSHTLKIVNNTIMNNDVFFYQFDK